MERVDGAPLFQCVLEPTVGADTPLCRQMTWRPVRADRDPSLPLHVDVLPSQ
jgi:hypothetical protein